MSRRERLSMPWHGPAETPEISAIHDDNEHVLLAHQFDDPTAPWLVSVTWKHANSSWRPVEVSVRSTIGAPVTASLWRVVPVTRAIRWSSAVLRETGKLATKSARADVVKEFGARTYDSQPPRDGRLEYEADHWDRVIEAWNAVGPVHDRRRAIARYLHDQWPDDQRYKTINSPTDTRVKGWLDRLAKDGRIKRTADTTKGGNDEGR